MSTTRPDCPKARATEARDLVLILCGHGAQGASAAAERHAEAIRQRAIFGAVYACCLKGRPTLGATIALAKSRPVAIAPLLMSRGRTWSDLVATARRERPDGTAPTMIGEPVGLDPGVADIVRRRATRTCQDHGWRPSEVRLILVAHGTERDSDAREAALMHAGRIEAARIFTQVTPAFLNDRPRLDEALAASSGVPCVLAGLFVEHGAHGTGDIEKAMRRAEGPIAYAGPIGDDAGFDDIIINRILKSGGHEDGSEMQPNLKWARQPGRAAATSPTPTCPPLPSSGPGREA